MTIYNVFAGMTRIINNIALILFSGLIALLLGECALRFLSPHTMYKVRYPNTSVTIPGFSTIPGLTPNTRFSTNSIGLRGAEIPNSCRIRILALGGSTTECLLLDDSLVWTALLQEGLNDNSEIFWVGNAGVSGHLLAHHLEHMKIVPSVIEGINIVILLAGINDMYRALLHGGDLEDPRLDPHLIRKAFRQYPRHRNPRRLQRSEIWMHLRDAKFALQRGPSSRSTEDNDRMHRDLRSLSEHDKWITEVPNLQKGLLYYEDALLQFLDLATDKGVIPIFLTQPSMNSSYTTNHFATPLHVSDGQKFSTSVRYEALSAFNDVMRKVGVLNDVHVVDLDQRLAKDTSVFYDECHFNISGSKQVAQILADEIPIVLKSKMDTLTSH